MVNKRVRERITVELSAYLKYLHQDGGVGIRELWRRYPAYSLRTIHRHATASVASMRAAPSQSTRGRKKKLSARDERMLMRAVHENRRQGYQVTSKRLQLDSGLLHVSNKTIRRTLNSHGYHYLQARRKGLMTKADLKVRLKFAKDIIKNENNETLWKEKICFYLDGTSWVFKTNPCDQARHAETRVWRKPSEGLSLGCTSKGKKVGYGGKVVHYIVCISYGKGVISCEKYEKMSGAFFASFIQQHFTDIFSRSHTPTGNIFLQDGDPSQNSKAAKVELTNLGYKIFSIPPRSPDLNPIENLFNLVDKKLQENAIAENIVKETYDEFAERVKRTMLAFPVETIDSIIDTMPKRIRMLVEKKGERLKY